MNYKLLCTDRYPRKRTSDFRWAHCSSKFGDSRSIFQLCEEKRSSIILQF